MLKNLRLTAAMVILTIAGSAMRADERQGKPARQDGIQAEVRGTLQFKQGRGYFISVQAGGQPERKYRVWLWISEQKGLVRQLQGLTGKQVIARGNLEQMPEDVGASVPPLGMYLQRFKIEGVRAK
jgi:hypothetical protein